MKTVAIVGASLAGLRCAQGLRADGFTGRVVVVGEETVAPYDRPALSKEMLIDPVAPVRLLGDVADVELHLGVRAEGVDIADRCVVTVDGRRIAYDRLVIATGARARPSPWQITGLRVLRTLADSRILAADLDRGGPLVVIGAGFIGAEVAAAARLRGLDVTVVDQMAYPLSRAIGPRAGRLLADLHECHGARLRLSTGVEGISGESGAFEVRLSGGELLRAASVVVAIGAVPNDEWLRDSGIEVTDGVVCDEHCRVVGAPDVYAAGDVASVQHARLGRPFRHEHWTSAVEQAQCVAHGIAHPDDPRPFRALEYVWSDQYGVRIQVVGRPAEAIEETVIVNPNDESQLAMLGGDAAGGLLGAVVIDWPRATIECRRALSAGESDEETLERIRHLLANAA